jgi:hypothetical protein
MSAMESVGASCQRTKARGEGSAAVRPLLGQPKKTRARACRRSKGRAGQAGMGQQRGRPKARRREGDQCLFLLKKTILLFPFLEDFEFFFLTSVKTTHHKNKYAAA